ncbi:PKD domain-containing protein [Solirubrobacter soli]|uniref:PKD domain-containing protein n=1 Tax=Solirubrobacter soli TaxID=363832 RepID=UPI0004853815|nr:PKD domain-containing protein [Solirubrobacter soli]
MAIALAALLCAALSTSAANAARGLEGRIAFAPSQTTIKTVEGDGTRGKDAYTGAAPSEPAYSPDGRRLAFADQGIKVISDGGSPKTVADAGTRPAFSADGKTIAFVAPEGLFTVPAAGGTRARIALPAGYTAPRDPAYSPDGRLFAFSALDASGDRRIYIKNLETDAITPLTTSGGRQELPAFSPDSADVTYVDTPLAPGGGFGFPRLAVRPLSGGAPDILWSNQVEPGREVSGRPAYSPAGNKIAFTVTKPGDPACTGDLMLVNTDGAANPRSIGCSTGTVDWGARPATGVNKLMSALPGSSRESASAASDSAQISAAGRYAVFTSDATNLVAGTTDENEAGDVFVRDLAAGKTILSSTSESASVTANGVSDLPLINANGTHVVFRSTATNLTRLTGAARNAVYAQVIGGRSAALISRRAGSTTVPANGDNRPVAINAAGNRVLFSSTGTNLVDQQGESDQDADLFAFDIAGGATHLVTAKAGSETTPGNGAAGRAFMSEDGRYVAFESTATDLVEGFTDANGDAPSIFKRDITTGTTTLVDAGTGTPQLTGISADGQTVLYTDGDALYANATRVTDKKTTGSKAASGKVLYSTAEDGQVYARATDGTTTRISNGVRPDQPANGPSTLVDATDDGAYVLVSSTATDLTWPHKHHDDAPSLYRIETATGEAEALTALGDDTADKAATGGTIAADGKVVTYTSTARNLIDGFIDGNGEATDVYAWMERSAAERDPLPPTITVVTPKEQQVFRQDQVVFADYSCEDEGPSGIVACDGTVAAGQPLDTSTTGEFEFKVTAKDAAGNTRSREVSYIVAAANKKLSLATRTVNGSGSANAHADSVSMSSDGRYVVFRSGATDLVKDFINANQGDSDVYRRDVVTGKTELVSVGLPRDGDNGRPRGANDGATLDSATRAISPDGRYVLFSSDATNLTERQNFPAGTQLYLRDMQEGVTKLVTHRPDGLSSGDADPSGYAFSRDGKTVVFAAAAAGLVPDDTNAASDIFTYDLATAALTLVSVESTGKFPADRYSNNPLISTDGRRVVFQSRAQNLLSKRMEDDGQIHLFWRDLQTGTTKLVDRKWDKPQEGGRWSPRGARLSADGAIVLFGSEAPEIVEGYAGTAQGEELTQLYLRDMTTDGPATLVTTAFDNPKSGTGGEIQDADFSRDGRTVIWFSRSHRVIADFVDHNDNFAWDDGGDLYIRTPDAPVRLAAHGFEGPNHGLRFSPRVRSLADNGRWVTVYMPTEGCDKCHIGEDVQRLDLKRNKFTNVVAEANDYIDEVVASDDGRRVAVVTAADNLIDGFIDNSSNQDDVFTWYDAPPVAKADVRITGSLKLEFDGSDSADSDGTIDYFTWKFGDGDATADTEKASHVYPDEGTYDVTLTIEDDGGNEVVHTFQVVAIKGILTTGQRPLDFLGVDKHLRCSVVRDGPVLADGGGNCGTFVAVDGKTYGPPELLDGIETYTPVSQDLTTEGDVTKLVTVVAVGETGLKVRQTDQYKAGKDWYRTDVDVINDGATAMTATVYRGARCEIGDGAGRRSIHDAATQMAGCDGAGQSGRLLAAWLPLTAGAKRDAGAADSVYGRIKAGAAPADSCACGSQPDPAAAIGWPVEVAAKGHANLASVAAFGPDGSIPVTLALKADKDQVQPLDDNAYTVTLRNPNAGERAITGLAVDSTGAWDVTPGTTTGLTTAEPTVAGTVATWSALKIGGHAGGELRFGVQHRSGQRTTTTLATPSGGEYANLAAVGIADLPTAGATVVARSDGSAKPNTAITSGPSGATTDRNPAFGLEASKEDVHYECRFGDDAWAPCEGNPHRPGPLADGPYVLEARAVDGVGADETPAKRSFLVDTAAPATTLSSAPHGTISDPRPNFFFSASEAGAKFQCRLDGAGRAGAWFACENPYRPSALADGEWTFSVKAVDAAGNEDATPATATFTIDTTPPVTVIDGITGKVLGANRTGSAAAAGGSGSTVALGADGAAALNVSCPADGPACEGTVGLASAPATASASAARASASPRASAAQARGSVPANAVTLARIAFSAQPGQTVGVRLPLSKTVRNTVERVGRMAVFTTIDLGTGSVTRGSDVVLTPDPRTVRLLNAGRTVAVKGGFVKLPLVCPATACKGSVKIGAHDRATFTIKRRGTVRVRISSKTKRGKELTVLLNTRSAPSKRLTLTLRAQEARR